MYLEYFNFEEFPFGLTPNTQYFCNLPSYQEALNVLLLSLRSGEGFIKIVGEVGTGKTMLCHALLNNLAEDYVTAYIANPSLSAGGMRWALANELGVEIARDAEQHEILEQINRKLLEHSHAGKKVVVIVDEAQVLSDEAFEALRLLSNLETESSKLLQIVLFGQTELDDRLNQNNLRQLKQRIAFSYYLRPVNRDELQVYVDHRLYVAGNRTGSLFTKKAFDLLYNTSKGVPRLVNVLCHKALLAAYGGGSQRVNLKEMQLAIKDTDSVRTVAKEKRYYIINAVIITLIVVVMCEVFYLSRLYL